MLRRLPEIDALIELAQRVHTRLFDEPALPSAKAAGPLAASPGGRTSRLPLMSGRNELVHHEHKRPANANRLMGDTGLEPVTVQ